MRLAAELPPRHQRWTDPVDDGSSSPSSSSSGRRTPAEPDSVGPNPSHRTAAPRLSDDPPGAADILSRYQYLEEQLRLLERSVTNGFPRHEQRLDELASQLATLPTDSAAEELAAVRDQLETLRAQNQMLRRRMEELHELHVASRDLEESLDRMAGNWQRQVEALQGELLEIRQFSEQGTAALQNQINRLLATDQQTAASITPSSLRQELATRGDSIEQQVRHLDRRYDAELNRARRRLQLWQLITLLGFALILIWLRGRGGG